MSDGDGSCSARKDSRPTVTNKPIDVSRCDKKRQRILTAASLLNQRWLKPLHQLDIPEPPEVVVEAARIVVGVSFKVSKDLRGVFAQEFVATDGNLSGVCQLLPAGQ